MYLCLVVRGEVGKSDMFPAVTFGIMDLFLFQYI